MAMSQMSKLIALSAGGDDRELAEHGLGMEHVNELMVRLSRQLLQDGHRLAFGGALGVPDAELTTLLINAALGWLGENAAKAVDVTQPSSWPLVNYTEWPHYTLILPERKAELVGVCDFVEVPPPDVPADELSTLSAAGQEPARRLEIWRTNLVIRRYIAAALTRMRELSTIAADLRIVWGGRIRGAAGWMAGIAEEVLFSLRLERPVLILGGFGGCARVLADFLKEPNADWPSVLTLDDACRDPAYAALITDVAHRGQLAARYDDLQQSCTALRTNIHAGRDIHGVPVQTFLSALTEESARRAIRMACDVANSLN
jgi:hypothetical protein